MLEIKENIITTMHKEAVLVRDRAYAPYSKFYVGCSVLAENGEIFSGCNVENASYGLTVCAEVNAISALIANGMKKIEAILIVGEAKALLTPCGACRQWIREFAKKDSPIYLSDTKEVQKAMTIDELLPFSFGPEYL